MRAAAVASALWVAAALAFGGVLWLWRGPGPAGQYLAGYLLEKSLSVDNLFVFIALFASFGVPPSRQRRVLQFGVLGALVLRGAFIAAGGALIGQAGWIFYVFGALVLAAGIRMLRAPHVTTKPAGGEPGAVRWLRRMLPVTAEDAGDRFVVRRGGRLLVTPLFLALVAIEASDLVFALDSVPAVFGVTSDLLIVFTSNAFAVLGLRALYFLLAGAAERFGYLKPGVAVLLIFIGVKMLIAPVVHVPVTVTLAVIVAVIGTAVVASWWRR